MTASDTAATVALADVEAARAAIAGVARETPVLSAALLSERCGGCVALKAENLQRTGSFKLRGAYTKLSRLDRAQRARGAVTGSAGNHAQAVAYAAARLGIEAKVFMPQGASLAKIGATQDRGAEVVLVGESFDETVRAALADAAERGAVYVHAFDDPAVIAGQGTLGLELAAQVPDLQRVLVPLGGGGLTAGVAIALKALRPEIEVIGVQAAACAPYRESVRRGEPVTAASASTIADGIAVKRPGEITLPLVRRYVDDIVVVSDEETAEAMVWLLERSKLVVEGAGAVGVAALLHGHAHPAAEGTTVAVLSGGNVDTGLLSQCIRLHETEAGRRLVLFTRISDRPGGLAHLLQCIADQRASVVDVEHIRDGVALSVRETAVEVVLETRGAAHAEEVLEALRQAGYELEVRR